MGDLISRQRAIDRIRGTGYVDQIKENIIMVLMGLPSAQPEPKKGHWIWVAGDLECPKCHTRYPDLYPDYDNAVACPHCGCKMEVEHDSDLHAE